MSVTHKRYFGYIEQVRNIVLYSSKKCLLRERADIQKDSGSTIELEEIQEVTDTEPIVDTSTQPETRIETRTETQTETVESVI
jgi:hypothetical protein